MIQNEDQFLELVDATMDYEDVIFIAKKNGAEQITCTKILIRLFKLKLKEANDIVQNSAHWKDFKSGNTHLKNTWFE